MFPPDVEARFRRIEDAQIVAAELLHHFERESKERMGRLESIQDALATWQDQIADKVNILFSAMDGLTHKMDQLTERVDQLTVRMDQLTDTVAELSRTVDRFLKARMDGGGTT